MTFVASTKPVKRKNKKTVVEELMASQLHDAGLAPFQQNAYFIRGRKFQADFWWPEKRIALEVDGGVWMPRSGHTSGAGYTSDRERDVEALLQGIITVRYTSDQVRNGYAISTFKRIFDLRGPQAHDP